MLLIQFVFLQLCDVFTTLVFLSLGVVEGNPIVRLAMGVAKSYPAIGLVAVKAAGFAFGWYAWRSGRRRLLARINWMFALCVAWNVVAIVKAVT